jgi:hypothetical protein
MTLLDHRWAASVRPVTVLAVIAGVVLTATGPATVTGLLPYFTIQSNVAYGAFAGWAAYRTWLGEEPIRHALKGAVTLYIVITGVVYHTLLANPDSPFWVGEIHRTPAEAIGNQLLHTVVPLLAVFDWLAFDVRGRYRWQYAALWLAFPLGYLVFALLRGLVVDTYPYPFLDVHELGYRGVTISAVGLGVAFWLLGLLLVGADRVIARGRGRDRVRQVR